MRLTPEPPSNVVAINPEAAKELEIKLKQQAKEWPCSGIHKGVTVDPKTRTVKCNKCGFIVDPFDYLLSWANDADRRMTGLKNIEIQRRISEAELDDLNRKIKNARAALKRAGRPQPEVERNAWNRWRDNPENSECAIVATNCQSPPATE